MIKAATCTDLKKLIEAHLKQTEGHVKKIEQVFKLISEKVKGQKCEATVGLLKEGDDGGNPRRGKVGQRFAH